MVLSTLKCGGLEPVLLVGRLTNRDAVTTWGHIRDQDVTVTVREALTVDGVEVDGSADHTRGGDGQNDAVVGSGATARANLRDD